MKRTKRDKDDHKERCKKEGRNGGKIEWRKYTPFL